jgi:hypothetical protein
LIGVSPSPDVAFFQEDGLPGQAWIESGTAMTAKIPPQPNFTQWESAPEAISNEDFIVSEKPILLAAR